MHFVCGIANVILYIALQMFTALVYSHINNVRFELQSKTKQAVEEKKHYLMERKKKSIHSTATTITAAAAWTNSYLNICHLYGIPTMGYEWVSALNAYVHWIYGAHFIMKCVANYTIEIDRSIYRSNRIYAGWLASITSCQIDIERLVAIIQLQIPRKSVLKKKKKTVSLLAWCI